MKEIKNTVVEHYAGSISYGTNIEGSDTDIRGIFCADEVAIRTPYFPVREVTMEDEEDGKLYELTNYVNLYTQGNPNILESLWVNDEHIISRTPAYELLVSVRQELLSKKVAFTYSGYAIAQLHKLKGHHKYINQPQAIDPPKQTDYVKLVHNLSDRKIFKIKMSDIYDGYRLIPYGGNIYGVYEVPGYKTYDHLHTLNTNTETGDLSGFYTKEPSLLDKMYGLLSQREGFGTRKLPLFIVQFNRDQYKKDKEKWKSYWSWKRNRNPARRILEEESGYDRKHGMHLVRLLNMAEEILTDGEVKVYRPDRELLLDIRNGKYSYEELMEMVEGKDEYIRNELYNKSQLPKTPNIHLASKILMEAQDCIWRPNSNIYHTLPEVQSSDRTPEQVTAIASVKDRMLSRYAAEEDARETTFCESMDKLKNSLIREHKFYDVMPKDPDE